MLGAYTGLHLGIFEVSLLTFSDYCVQTEALKHIYACTDIQSDRERGGGELCIIKFDLQPNLGLLTPQQP